MDLRLPFGWTDPKWAGDGFNEVLKWAELAGAQCAIIPSPDVLVYTLAKYAEEKWQA